MEEVIWFNLGWLLIVWLFSMLMGIAWAWEKKVVFGVVIIGGFLFLIVTLVAIGQSSFGDTKPWYYFIGSSFGGLTWRLPFKVGVWGYEEHFA